jgi:hypothetical protein
MICVDGPINFIARDDMVLHHDIVTSHDQNTGARGNIRYQGARDGEILVVVIDNEIVAHTFALKHGVVTLFNNA